MNSPVIYKPRSVLPNWSWPGSVFAKLILARISLAKLLVYLWCIPTHTMISWCLDQVGEFLDISPHSCLFHGYSVFKQGVVIQENTWINSFSWITTPCLNLQYPLYINKLRRIPPGYTKMRKVGPDLMLYLAVLENLWPNLVYTKIKITNHIYPWLI